MRSKTGLFLLVFCCLTFLAIAVEKLASPLAQGQSASQPTSTNQTQALQEDLNKMRVLVQQMETNLSFVDTTQSPLKHQFQLEIDAWRLTIQRMDRELQGK